MDFEWSFFIDLGIVSLVLLLSTLIRAKVPFFQRYLIPNALTAGFILLPAYNFLAPKIGVSSEGLGQVVYHLLSISFIAMMLRRSEEKTKGSVGVLGTAVIVVLQYALQAFLGLTLTIVMIKTFLPELFPSFGLFVPLGFGLGPGQSYAIGQGWEELGFSGAGSVGLTFAAIGFLLACFCGVFLINLGSRRGWLASDVGEASSGPPNADAPARPARAPAQPADAGAGISARSAGAPDPRTGRGVYPRGAALPEGSRLTTESDAIESMGLHIAMVFMVYLLSFLFLKLLTFLLSMAGDLGRDLAVNLWGIGFVFAALVALLVRKTLEFLHVHYILDDGSLTRISGTAVDYMVAAAIGAISLVVVGRYWLPILIIAGLAGVMVFCTVLWLASRMFRFHRFKRTLIIFGAVTGTLPTGLALLRVVDPEFKTPVAGDYVYCSAITFAFSIPLILIINLPAYSVSRGNPFLVWLTLIVIIGYLVVGGVFYTVLARRKGLRRPGRLWYREDD